MISQLARQAGHDLHFGRVSPLQWNHAAAQSMTQVNVREPSLSRATDLKPIVKVFQQISAPIERARSQER